jgi:hypothetical protein
MNEAKQLSGIRTMKNDLALLKEGGSAGFVFSLSHDFYFKKETDAPQLVVSEKKGGPFTVSLSASPEQGGTVSGQGKFEEKNTVQISALPNKGYRFLNWSENKKPITSQREYSFVVNKDISLEAVFVETEEKKKAEEEALKKAQRDREEREKEILKQKEIERKRAEEERRRREIKDKKEKLQEEDENTLIKKQSDFELEKNDFLKEISFLEVKRKELIQEKESFQKFLENIALKEKEIEKETKEIKEKEISAKNTNQEKQIKEEKWSWEEKRRKIEEERWSWEEKISLIDGKIEEIENKKKIILEKKIFLEGKIKEIETKLEKIDLQKKKQELISKISQLCKPNSILEKSHFGLMQERQLVEIELQKINQEEKTLKGSLEEIERKEFQASSTEEKKLIEQKRWRIEETLRKVEENRLSKTEILEKIKKEEKEAEDKYREAFQKERVLMDELEKIKEGLAENQVQDDVSLVRDYIEKNSETPKEDLERAGQDENFFKYILKKVKNN